MAWNGKLYLCLMVLMDAILFCGCFDNVAERERVIQEILDNSTHKVPPNIDRDIPTVVTIQLFIISFDSISESSMDYSMNVFIREYWNDHRIRFHLRDTTYLELDSRAINKIWVPDVYFLNEKEASLHDVTVPNKLMHISPIGNIFYSVKISMTLSCEMKLEKFPFDTQLCYLIIESFGYTTKSLIFKWHSKPILTAEKIRLPQFNLDDFHGNECETKYGISGRHTCLRAAFHLSRNYGYHLAQVYIPSMLIVILSWVSFWLDPKSVPARVTLGLLTVLSLATQSSNVRETLPRVSYIKAIDIWMFICLVFVFSALIEFAFVSVISRNEHAPLPLGCEELSDRKSVLMKVLTKSKALELDQLSRLCFPIAFIAFNVLYWCFYMIWEPEMVKGF